MSRTGDGRPQGRRCSGHRSRTPGHRNCTWPPTAPSGLTDWTYDRIECTAAELAPLVGGFGPEWVGLSVTMPGKFAALAFADERTARAELVGSANTLVRTATGWRADNTDVDGVTGALGQALSDRGSEPAARRFAVRVAPRPPR